MQQFMSLTGTGAGAVVRELVEVPDDLVPGEHIFTEAFAKTLVPFVAGVQVGYVQDAAGNFAPPPEPAITAAQLVAYAAARRFAVETGGLSVNGLTIATDRDSQSMIANAYAGMQASGAASVKFKATSGWIELSADQIKAIALAVFAHVQACFAAEDGCDAGINASPPTITSFAEVDAAFASLAAA
ncbi:DUF4376 domain-containing protein [Methylobacterium sp. yr668]|uniref:DUF4376 domain-containing protein n=1 Tax=Methylobacterium sp. yr668 TaxID=1761801 RepID=UPI0008E27CCD|nr:DUF4376 domain-containing protein [Methylobacterium sp. yr668]SFT11860.1 protein of unknown function [Methylobacterium sp. yr668]